MPSSDLCIVIFQGFQQQAEALAMHYKKVIVLYNDQFPPRNLEEIRTSGRAHYHAYSAATVWQEWRYWVSLIREIKPNVVYANGIRQLILLAIFSKIRLIIPNRYLILATSHNSKAWRNTIQRHLLAIICNKFADGFFALARFQESWMKSHGSEKERIKYIPNPVDTVQFCPQHKGKKRNSTLFRILFPADLTPSKGHELLFHAFANLLPDFPRTELLLLGRDITSGGYENKLRKLAITLGINKNIVFGQTQNHSKMPSFFCSADVVVLPSWSEVCSYSILEAMSCARPIIASDAGGNGDLILNEECGLIFHKGDIHGLEQALRSIFIDPKLRSRLGFNARQRAEQYFSLSVVGAMHREFITRLFYYRNH